MRAVATASRRSLFLLTTRQCANAMGVGTEWIRTAIVTGVRVDRRLVRLEAEAIPSGSRTEYRIPFDAFVAFLRGIGWRRLPRMADVAPERAQRVDAARESRHASA